MGKMKQSSGLKKTISSAKNGKKSNLNTPTPNKLTSETYKYWRDKISSNDLNADNFFSETVNIVESAPQCFAIVDGLIEVTQLTDQTKIRLISYDDIYNLVYGHISMKHVSSFIATSLKKAIVEAKAEMRSKNVISVELQALLIKLQMFIIRDQYISHKINFYALQKAISNERNALLYPLVCQQVPKISTKNLSKNAALKRVAKDKKKKGKEDFEHSDNLCDYVNKTTKYPISDEIRRKMKNLKQSEDFNETYEGTDLYFALIKFYDQELLIELNNIGIPTVALIDMAIDELDFSTNVSHEMLFETSDATKVRRLDISNFWRAYGLADGNQQFAIPPEMCYLRYCPPDVTSDYTSVYDDLLRIVQNITDFKRQHANYLDNVKFLDISEDKPPMKIQNLRTYNLILSHVPNECQSVPVILHALIEEVSEQVPCEFSTSGRYSLDSARKIKHTKNHLGAREQVLNLRKQDKNEVYNNSNVTLYKSIRVPYGNVISYMVGFTSFSEDLKTINVEALKSIMPLTLFKHYFKLNMSNTLTYNYLFHKWSNNFEEMTTSQLKHCLHSYLFKHAVFHKKVIPPTSRKITTVEDLLFSKLKAYNQKSEKNPEVHIKFLLSSFIRKGLKRTKTLPEISQRLEYCEHLEEYDHSTMLQMVNIAYDNMKCFDHKFFAPHDVMLIRFHARNTGLEYCKSSTIRTRICFRDFCAYIIPLETDWLLDQEILYWDTKITDEAKKNQESPEKTYNLKESDFIRAGSLQDKHVQDPSMLKRSAYKVIKEANPIKTTNSNFKKNMEIDSMKNEIGSKEIGDDKEETHNPKAKESKILKAWKSSIEATPQIKYLHAKQYSYEGYDLSSDYYELQHSTKKYSSIDGISVTVNNQQWTNDKNYYSFNLSINDNHLIFHCLKKKIISTGEPFLFHLNLSNGVIMALSSPLDEKHSMNQKGKHIVIYDRSNTNTDITSQHLIRSKTLQKIRRSHIEYTMSSVENNQYLQTKRKIIRRIHEAARIKIPVFKICSSRLHKYLYVKRIKSHIEVPIGKIMKRFVVKPKIYPNIQSKRKLLVSQCIPALDVEKSQTAPDFFWKTTLPTGLWIQSVRGTEQDPMYIKQGYIIDRPDISIIQDEDYRIFLRGRVLSFRKTGDVLSMTFNRSIGLHHYGYFSSNISKTNSKLEQLRGNIHLPSLHKASKDIPQLERKIQKVCKKYNKHLIGLSKNHRLESKRERLRNEHKTYKLTKAIYMNAKSLLPVMKYTMVVGDGSKYSVDRTKIIKEENKFYSTTYNDYLKKETLIYRQDGTSWFLDNNGRATTQFPDNTRITTWASVLEENLILDSDELETFESSNTTKTSTNTSSERFNRIIDMDSKTLTSLGSTMKINNTEDSSLLNDSCEYLFKRSMIYDNSYVLIGMNYKYEHPNYMPVTQYCIDSSITVDLPDGFSATIFKEGSYKVNLQKGEIIDIDKKHVKLQTESCGRCHGKTECKINVHPLYSKQKKKETNSKDTFLYMEDRENKIIKIDFQGNLTEEFGTQDSLYNTCACEKPIYDRYFVLNRDLTGSELFIHPKPNRFICTLDHFDAPPETNNCNITKCNCTCMMQQLFKTYSEHLMMLYDTPMLGLENNITETKEIFRTFNYDRRNVLKLRSPVFIYERTIYHLSFIRVLDSLITGFNKYFHSEGGKNVFQSISSLVDFINEHQTPPKALSTVISSLQTAKDVLCPYERKIKRSKTKTEKFTKLVNRTKPKFFEIVRGFMSQIIHECLDKALDIVEKKEMEYYNFKETSKAAIADGSQQNNNGKTLDLKCKIPFMSEVFEIVTSNVVSSPRSISLNACDHSFDNNSETQSKYNFIIRKPNIRNNMIMHLKPYCSVDDIVLTAKSIQTITDKKIVKVPISINDHHRFGFDGNHTSSSYSHEKNLSSMEDQFINLDHVKPCEKITSSKIKDREGTDNWDMSHSFTSYSSQTSIDMCTNSSNLSGKPKLSMPTRARLRTTGSLSSMDATNADGHQIAAKTIAKKIFKALIHFSSRDSNIQLSRYRIKQIVHNELQTNSLQNKETKSIVQAVESLIYPNAVEPNNQSILDITIGLLNEIRHDLNLRIYSQEDTKMYEFFELEDLAVKVSVILYRVHEMDTKKQITKNIKELISTYQLSKTDIKLVLDLTVEGLKEDFKSCPIKIDEENMSEMGLQILNCIDMLSEELITRKRRTKVFPHEFLKSSKAAKQKLYMKSPFYKSGMKKYSCNKNKDTVHRDMCSEADNSHKIHSTPMSYVKRTKDHNQPLALKQRKKPTECIRTLASKINSTTGSKMKEDNSDNLKSILSRSKQIELNSSKRLSAGVNSKDDLTPYLSRKRFNILHKSRSSSDVQTRGCWDAEFEKTRVAFDNSLLPFQSVTGDFKQSAEEKFIDCEIQTGISLTDLKRETFDCTSKNYKAITCDSLMKVHKIKDSREAVNYTYQSGPPSIYIPTPCANNVHNTLAINNLNLLREYNNPIKRQKSDAHKLCNNSDFELSQSLEMCKIESTDEIETLHRNSSFTLNSESDDYLCIKASHTSMFYEDKHIPHSLKKTPKKYIVTRDSKFNNNIPYEHNIEQSSSVSYNTGKRVSYDDRIIESSYDETTIVRIKCKKTHMKASEYDIDLYKNTTKQRSVRRTVKSYQKEILDIQKPELRFLPPPTNKTHQGYSKIGKPKGTPYQNIKPKTISHENKSKPISPPYKDLITQKSVLHKDSAPAKTTGYEGKAKRRIIPYAHWNTAMTRPEPPPSLPHKPKLNPYEDSMKFPFGMKTKLRSTVYAEKQQREKRIQDLLSMAEMLSPKRMTNHDNQLQKKTIPKPKMLDYFNVNTPTSAQDKCLGISPTSSKSSTDPDDYQVPEDFQDSESN